MKTKQVIHYVLSLLTIVGLVYFVILNTPNPNISFGAYEPYFKLLINGFLWSVLISIMIFVFSFILGFVMFFGQRSKIPYIEFMVRHVTNIMFGSPMLVVVMLGYFFVAAAFDVNNKLLVGVVTLTIYFAPFMMKLFISAYESIDHNQVIVSDIFGFTKVQMYRYVLLPQMLRIMMPPLSGNLANIIKSSSLLYLIGFKELYYNITTVQSRTFAYTEGFLIMLAAYLLITLPLLKLTDYLEGRIKI